ncbi:MAG: SDR family oxidoreductase [Chloroflexi bacterium]|nr:SDR family oxidoreductase [Chloroflexota bacterium]MBU1748584.1 SDR family oxidoreductase [Chloroflexota bacterium]
MYSLQGKLALVTGGASDIGRAVCLALAEAGADLVIADAKMLGAQITAEKVRAFRRFTVALQVDLADPDQVVAMMAQIPEELMDRTPDILIYTAPQSEHRALLEHQDAAQWDRDVRGSLTGAYHIIQAVWPIFKEKGWGRVITTSSILADVGSAEQSALVAAQAALVALTRSLALEGAPHGITANTVLMGLISTASYCRLSDDLRERMVARVPLGCAGEPQDVAALVAFLASSAARYITGAAIPVAGGLGLFNV